MQKQIPRGAWTLQAATGRSRQFEREIPDQCSNPLFLIRIAVPAGAFGRWIATATERTIGNGNDSDDDTEREHPHLLSPLQVLSKASHHIADEAPWSTVAFANTPSAKDGFVEGSIRFFEL